MVSLYWDNLLAVGAYLLIVLTTCLTTAMLALFNSVIFRRTAHSMVSTYIAMIMLFCLPPAALILATTLRLPAVENDCSVGCHESIFNCF